MLLLFAAAGPAPVIVAGSMGSMSRFLLLGVGLIGRMLHGL